ncbi:hypothetical protein P153DRAFT_370921 [Dothidotthia symphoricarpi CBS 119687]|uniref:Cupin type-1 domain-containing protein n=1 Tax=Dothidotthia symphoricarpi CBS 119687 TaxID=1392245 RepID=A0A6A5ZZS0_9PLEO|nr:uncharacterized protein P153DRAFT_370921 [Dothidotthia symphoricarpi CBS 119687]KAF2124515.1 hypothetical protein P153DRAFT_370921 [Dothidotthia symphoricarpi CBS 119687]
MAIEVHSYRLPSTPLIPNSPYPLLHYPSLLLSLVSSPTFTSNAIFDLFASNGWQSQWIARYGPDIQSHYHSTTHECMAVISGHGATIRFGVSDHGSDGFPRREDGGIEIQAKLGDVFIIPAGVSHKTFAPRPETTELVFHQPKDVADVSPQGEEKRKEFFAKVPVQGEFMMMGAYPYGGRWDFAVGGEHEGKEEEVWGVDVPGKDPILGKSEEGLRGLWTRGKK